MNKINFKQEFANLKNPEEYNELEWFNPTQGSYTVKIENVGRFFNMEYNGKTVEKLRLEIDVNGEKYNWGITRAQSRNSLFGQLMAIGKDGSPEGKEFQLFVSGQGKSKHYIIPEAMKEFQKAEKITHWVGNK